MYSWKIIHGKHKRIALQSLINVEELKVSTHVLKHITSLSSDLGLHGYFIALIEFPISVSSQWSLPHVFILQEIDSTNFFCSYISTLICTCIGFIKLFYYASTRFADQLCFNIFISGGSMSKIPDR